MESKTKQHNRGGARANAGRPKKDEAIWGKINCVLRKDTIQALRAGCGGKHKHFGEFLQDHLDEYPLPDRETYLYRQRVKKLMSNGWRPNPEREKMVRDLKRQERERLRQLAWEKKHPEQKAFLKTLNQLKRKQAKEQATA